MTDSIISESAPCPSKTGHATRKTGRKSVAPSSNEPVTAAKAVPPIPTAAPATTNPTRLPEAASCSPSLTSTTFPSAASPPTCAPGASAATSLTTGDTMPEPEEKPAPLFATTGNPACLHGKKTALTRRQLKKQLSNKPEDLFLLQVTAETYRPAMDSIKAILEVYGSSAKPSLYVALNKQVSAKCQMNGINDPSAHRRQRIAALTMFEDIYEVHIDTLEGKISRERMNEIRNERLTRTALFHGLGTKKDRRWMRP